MFKVMVDELSFAETLTDEQKQELLDLLEEVDTDAYTAGQGDCDCSQDYEGGYDDGKEDCDEAK